MRSNNVKKLIERKVNIRQNAYANMMGLPESYIYGHKMDMKQIYEVNNHINSMIILLEENSCLLIHKNISCDSGRGIIRKYLKKIIRKIVEKAFGWYYLPLIAQQTTFNSYVVDTLRELQDMVINQYELLEELKADK